MYLLITFGKFTPPQNRKLNECSLCDKLANREEKAPPPGCSPADALIPRNRQDFSRGEATGRWKLSCLIARERDLYWQPDGSNPIYHRDDVVDLPRTMGV